MSETQCSDSYFIACLLNCLIEDLLIYQYALYLNMFLSECYVLCHISPLEHNAKKKEYEFEQFLKRSHKDELII